MGYTLTKDGGVNYSGGSIVNIDLETGIRYGVIPQNACVQAWADSSEPEYPEPECPECGAGIPEDADEEWVCKCGEKISMDYFYDCAEPLAYVLDDGEYVATCGDGIDIFVIKSPYFTYAQYCSPCAPGACYLLNPCEPETGDRAYCLGADWFEDEDGGVPYPIYSVATGELVETSVATEEI